jgi:GTP-binding protein EngB required for normal cell division
MPSSENPRARLESGRLSASGNGPTTSARDPADGPEATSNNSTPLQPPVYEPRAGGPKASLDELLTRAISSTRGSSEAQQQILERLRELRTRFEEGRLRVAVIGQFKRGKSTLLNALLGASILPTGVTPITAIPTFIEASNSAWVRVAFNNGREPVVTTAAREIPALLERHISEAENPRNRLDVESVAIGVRSTFLDEGIVLVDTPGVGSTFRHNTLTAEAVLTECDAALFVLSADPPITETEVSYLDKVRSLIPKIFFILNKADLLDTNDKSAAQRFLAGVLAERYSTDPPDRIFALSAKQGIDAKLTNDVGALASSGLSRLESVLGAELAREKRAILLAAGRQRLISLVSELLFQCDLERKALMTPEEDLKRKAATFETSAVEFESERQRLADLLAIDCKQLLRELDGETDRVWNEARCEVHQVVAETTDFSAEPMRSRERITTTLSHYFASALQDSVRSFQVKLEGRVSNHRARADALINLVYQTAADLMEIPAQLPPSEAAFQPKREPYWVAPEPSISLLGIAGGLVEGFFPPTIREKRARARIVAEAEKAALRNVANLDWAMRQNIEDSFRRFESSLISQLDQAMNATRQAMQLALQRRAARSEAVKGDIDAASRSVTALSLILRELEAIPPIPQRDATSKVPSSC